MNCMFTVQCVVFMFARTQILLPELLSADYAFPPSPRKLSPSVQRVSTEFIFHAGMHRIWVVCCVVLMWFAAFLTGFANLFASYLLPRMLPFYLACGLSCALPPCLSCASAFGSNSLGILLLVEGGFCIIEFLKF